MIFNKAAKELISKIDMNINIVSHDWFIYQLISGTGGNIYYDDKTSMLYRQHSNNLIGSNIGIIPRIKRLKKLINGSFRK